MAGLIFGKTTSFEQSENYPNHSGNCRDHSGSKNDIAATVPIRVFPFEPRNGVVPL